MIRFTEQHLRSKPNRKEGYVLAVLQMAVRDGEWLTLTDEQLAQIRADYALIPVANKALQPITRPPCVHLGEPTGESVSCATCSGHVVIKLFACGVHGSCTTGKRVVGTASCVGCAEYQFS